MTERAQIAAKHRNSRQDAKAEPDKACMGKKVRKKKPWVIELKYPKNTSEKYSWFEKMDGQWHVYIRYVTQRAAKQALAGLLRKKALYSCIRIDKKTNTMALINIIPEHRIRDTQVGFTP